MDNVTHSLTGLVLARAGLNRFGAGATLVMILSANAPDIDIVAAPFGALSYLEVHRGYTHCLLALPVMAALSVLVAAAVLRRKLPWMQFWLLACIGVASHLLLDWTNSYGIRLLLPFSSRWLALDLNSLTDGLFLSALFVASIWPLFSRLVSSEIGERRTAKGQGTAIAAICFFLALDFTRWLMHERVIAQLTSRLYDGNIPAYAAALPTALSPFHWNGLVETVNSYREIDSNVLQNVEPEPGPTLYKHPFDPATEAVRGTPPFRYFQYFSRFPMWSTEPVTLPSGAATRVDLTDLRFGSPDSGSFHCVGVVDTDGHVLFSAFTFGSGMNLGRGH